MIKLSRSRPPGRHAATTEAEEKAKGQRDWLVLAAAMALGMVILFGMWLYLDN